MPMTFGKKLDTTRRYQIFFLLTAVLPIIMFSIHLLQNVYVKANNAVAVMLESGLLYVEDTVKANHHELKMSARQAALLSLNDSYHDYLRTRDSKRFITYLQRYRTTNAFDVVLIVSPKKRILFDVSQSLSYNIRSFSKLMDASLKNQTITGFERFHSGKSGRLHLAYVAAAPIPRSYNDKQVDGILLIGRYVKNDNAYSTLQRIMPQHLFRVIVKTPDGYHIELSHRDEAKEESLMTQALEQRLRLHESDLPSNQSNAHGEFEERIRNHTYMTSLFPLTNQHAAIAGYIAISVPIAELKEFMQENLGFISVFITLLLLWVFLAGRWFRRDVVDPMFALTHGLKKVTQGDLDTRLPISPDHHPEARETIRSFNHLVQRLEENEQLRATFISTLSHDLKTPLLAQQRVAKMLEENLDFSQDIKLGGFLAGLRQSNDNLLAMVYNLLETYEYEEGQITLSCVSLDVRQLLDQCFETVLPLAEEAQVILENRIPKDFPKISADPLQLKRVFINLVTNAMQNIPEGCLVWAEGHESFEAVHIFIRDEGPGLSDKVRQRLFLRYNSGAGLTKRIGSGLGLFICRMIVELHQGTIEAESVSGKGTSFHIILPKSLSNHSIPGENL